MPGFLFFFEKDRTYLFACLRRYSRELVGVTPNRLRVLRATLRVIRVLSNLFFLRVRPTKVGAREGGAAEEGPPPALRQRLGEAAARPGRGTPRAPGRGPTQGKKRCQIRAREP